MKAAKGDFDDFLREPSPLGIMFFMIDAPLNYLHKKGGGVHC
jgi:hypothetical protein